MSVSSPRRVLGGLALIFLTVGMLLLFAMAIASVLYITSDNGFGPRVSADGNTSQSPLSYTPQVEINALGVGGLTCQRGEANSATSPPFFLWASYVEGDPDPLIVEVRLSDGNGTGYARLVNFGVIGSSSAQVAAEVPNSFDPAYGVCTITAVQRGHQLVITSA